MNDIQDISVIQTELQKPYSLWLDSTDHAHPNGTQSLLFTNPVETITAKNGHISVSGSSPLTDDPFEILRSRMAKNPHCTAAGLFGYDLGRGLETLPTLAKNNPALPDMAIGLYKQEHIQKVTIQPSASHSRNFQPHTDITFRATMPPDTYKNHIQKVIDYIHAGDIFQANLAQNFEALLPENFDPLAHYLHLRRINPAPFAGYFNLGDIKISSCSPERFITVKNRQVETKPIKGTSPQSEDPAKLLNSEKDRAENIMIVDLLRNDLSRSCKPDSITVKKLCALESFASVHHLVSTITATLQNNQTALDILKACFPGGSITGAPKIRAMEIIEELEPARRGPYTGCLGYITPDGDMDSNILIRTLVFEPGKVSLSAGGGITACSNPEAEYQETLDKAAAIFKSFKSNDKTESESTEAA